MPIAELITEILARTAYDAILTAEFLGDRKLANLRKLVEQARAFDASGIFTLTAFIEQLSTSVVEQPDEAPAAAFAEGANVVRLMSIHQSKGLEFPVVFVPDLERKRQHNRANVAFHPDLGPMVTPPYREDGTSGLDLYRLVENREDEAESRRLFYVAVTRAADYLILSAGVEDPAVPIGEWRTLLAERFDLLTGQVIGGLNGLPKPDIRVTTERPKLDDDRTVRTERADWPKILEQVRKAAASPKAKLFDGTEPIAADLSSRRRFSFSRLSGKIVTAEEAEEERPGGEPVAALADDSAPDRRSLDVRTIGVAVHDMLAKFDYRALGKSGERAALETLARRSLQGAIGEQEGAVAELTGLAEAFLRSRRAASVAQARQVHRELEFLLAWPLDRPGDGGIYLQGFLDLVYEDAAGRWCVVDYKTHQTTRANVAVSAEPYKLQLAVYALAVEKILGRAPDELVLAFLRTGDEYVMPWNDGARKKAIAAVNQGLKATVEHEKE
ncbi:MAG: 3'-5' exonuclease [Pirellulales bacterium]